MLFFQCIYNKEKAYLWKIVWRLNYIIFYDSPRRCVNFYKHHLYCIHFIIQTGRKFSWNLDLPFEKEKAFLSQLECGLVEFKLLIKKTLIFSGKLSWINWDINWIWSLTAHNEANTTFFIIIFISIVLHIFFYCCI